MFYAVRELIALYTVKTYWWKVWCGLFQVFFRVCLIHSTGERESFNGCIGYQSSLMYYWPVQRTHLLSHLHPPGSFRVPFTSTVTKGSLCTLSVCYRQAIQWQTDRDRQTVIQREVKLLRPHTTLYNSVIFQLARRCSVMWQQPASPANTHGREVAFLHFGRQITSESSCFPFKAYTRIIWFHHVESCE